MGKIIVDNRSRLTDAEALLRAHSVVKMGRISGDGESYCYATRFPDSIVAVAVRNKSSDTITILDDSDSESNKNE